MVPVRDGASSLGALLDSLDAQELERERYEVIVVDNASRDATPDIAAARGARVVHEPIPNRARARNAGVAEARADVIAFTDADCIASPRWLAAMLECRGRAPLVAGAVRIQTSADPNTVERFEAMSRFGQEAWVRQGWAATANLMVERNAFDAVGGLDPAYRHIGEDADFCLRAGRAGFALDYCDAAVIFHVAEHEVGAVLRRAFFNGYSAAQVLRRVGRGHVAWRDPKPLLSPRAAVAFHGIRLDGIPSRERRAYMALASAAYTSRVAGSVWSTVRRAS